MSYLFQSRLFDDSGALQVVLADTIPLGVPRYEEWAADTDGRSFVTYAPAVLPITAQRRRIVGLGNLALAFNPTGSLYITDGAAKASTDTFFDGVRIRTDGVLYVSAVSPAPVPIVRRRDRGFATDSTGAMLVGGLTLLLNFADLGSGVADTTPSIGTASPTFTRATAGAAKLSTGLWKLDVASGSPRYSYAGLDTTVTTTGGYLAEGARTASALQNRDLTNAAWTKSNLTTAKTSTGIDGAANSCTRCTASAGNGTALQAVVLASAAKAFGVWIKRITGTGEIDITLDNGATWTNITAQINSVTFTLVQATQTLANPTVGIRIVTSADAIDVDVAQLEDGATFTSTPIPTTVAAVTRNADLLTYPFVVSNVQGTIFAQWRALAASGTQIVVGARTADGVSQNALFVYQNATQGLGQVLSNAVATADVGVNATVTNTVKAAMGYALNNTQAAVNGTAGPLDTVCAMPVGSNEIVIIGNVDAVGTVPFSFYGTISRTGAYNYRSKDTNLTTMTTA